MSPGGGRRGDYSGDSKTPIMYVMIRDHSPSVWMFVPPFGQEIVAEKLLSGRT